MTENWWDEDPGPRSVGAGLALALTGAALGALALLRFDWQDTPGSTAASLAHPNLAGIADEVDGFALDYFGGIGWWFLGIAAVVAIAAAVPLPGPASVVLRGASWFAAIIAAVTINEVYDLGLGATGRGPAFWLALAGFALLGVGGALGPRRVRERPAGCARKVRTRSTLSGSRV